MDKLNLADLKRQYKLESDSYDPWGSCMGAFFQLADEMERRGIDHPAEWKYRPGAMGPGDPAEWTEDDEPAFGWECVHATDEALKSFGALLHRYCGLLEGSGRSY